MKSKVASQRKCRHPGDPVLRCRTVTVRGLFAFPALGGAMPGKQGDITLTLSANGVPVSFVLNGRIWHVGAEPVRWFDRIS